MADRLAASDAFVNGDIEPLAALSATTPPATLFGPQGTTVQGAEHVNEANARGAGMFRPGASNAFEVMHRASDGHLAYWVGVQRSVVHFSGQHQPTPMDLRVTEIFKREPFGWKLIHRHADAVASEQR
ncbi:MAG: DUF4440 domain-containing protein [Humibacillus sp.]|nr:DUF4440 domain-containing protein [Humibacillus sp.]MDN5777920.1 DUF4440 domain-containing protein [Humibacillus sp.]